MHTFNSAKQVFIKNKRETVNFTAGFKCKFDAAKNKEYKLKITGATLYSVYLNGEFVFYGPARAPHGYIRYDEVPLSVNIGENILCVVVAGYNCPTFYTMNIKSFLQAEILENGNAIKYTGRDFSAISLDSLREKEAFRYSYQRSFNEVWHFDNSDNVSNWMTEDFASEPLNEYHLDLEFIERGYDNPEFNIVNFGDAKRHGRFRYKDDFNMYHNKRHVVNMSCETVGYDRRSVKTDIMDQIYGVYFEDKLSNMTDNRYAFYDLGRIDTGFICADITACEDSDVYFIFSETLAENGQPDSGINGVCTQNIIKYSLKKSDKPYHLQSFEAYSFRYLTLLVRKGSIDAKNVSLCEYVYPKSDNVDFRCADDELSLIFEAARQTFIQNTIDCYMDCPGRERAGWLCDSYFTSQAAQIFEGRKTEELFLKTFIMAKDVPGIDDHLLPMCYPGENNGVIVQWVMWYVLELRDYLKRNCDSAEFFKTFVYNFLDYLDGFKTECGLLNRLNGWNFIEWSDANEFVSESDISYPTNMLYAATLDAAAQIYSDLSLSKKADEIRRIIVDMAFDGELFCDGALMKNGSYVNLPNTSEACQYYAIFSSTAAKGDPRFDKFFDTVINTFGYAKKKRNYRPEVAHAAVFIGYSIRMMCLQILGEYDKLIDEIKGLYGHMAHQTLTLWEHDAPIASLNHGLSSVAAPLIIKALTGIYDINEVDRTITFIDTSVHVDYDITIGLANGRIVISNDENGKRVNVDGGYRIINKTL